MRSTPIRLAFAAVAMLALTACNDVQSGVDKTRDCASIVQTVSNINLNPNANPTDVANDLAELSRKVDDLRNPDVKSAAESLRAAVERFQVAVRSANVSAANKAIRKVREDGRAVATACNIPVDQLFNGGSG